MSFICLFILLPDCDDICTILFDALLIAFSYEDKRLT